MTIRELEAALAAIPNKDLVVVTAGGGWESEPDYATTVEVTDKDNWVLHPKPKGPICLIQ